MSGVTSSSPRARQGALWAIMGLLVVAITAGALEAICRLLFPAPLPWLMPQNRFEASATLGFRYRPSQTAFTADKPFRTNAAGLRGPEWSLAKPVGRRRVLVLGDSIAMGFGVREEDAFPAVLERTLGGGVEVVNGAVAAYSTDQEVRWYLDDGWRYQPDVVVIELYWNDVTPKTEVGVAPDGELIDRRSEGDQRGAMDGEGGYWLRNLLKRSRALYVLSFKLRQLQAMGQADPTRSKQMAVLTGAHDDAVAHGWQVIEQELGRLRAACERAGVSLLVVVPPMPQQLAASFPDVAYQSVVAGICERERLSCLDLLPAFANAYHGHESLFVAYDGDHPNEAGHALIARELARVLSGPNGPLAADPVRKSASAH